jgi:NAD(P)-dependent dehydrogenase (short-subunit alcohol dehydrogenase family)
MTLRDKRVVIIGGSSGIGLATAKAVAEEGAQIIIASRDESKLLAAKKQIKGDVSTKNLDVRSEEQIRRFFSDIDPFDHLITPGSFTSPGSCLEMDIREAKDSFESKFWGQYLAVKYGVPHMSKDGSIVLFSGVLSQRPTSNTAIMASINSAVEGLGRALAVELAPIRVNVISPGYVDTPRFSHMKEKDREMLFNHLGKQLPVGRIGRPEEIAQTVLYLLTNGYTTASTIYIDGGYSMR